MYRQRTLIEVRLVKKARRQSEWQRRTGAIIRDLRFAHLSFGAMCAYLSSTQCERGTVVEEKLDPGLPDGENRSLSIAVSADGLPEIGRRYTVEARCGVAVRVVAGQLLNVENTHGTQVCDFWAFDADDCWEFLSMEHLHTSLNSIFPKGGDGLVSNARRTLMTIVEDTSPGVHDTIIACCDLNRYRQLGCAEYHDNCADNLRLAMIAIGLRAPIVPAPFNLWMNIPVAADGSIQWLAPVSKSGDKVVFRAERDVIAVMSACPQDVTPVNGVNCKPTELHFVVCND